MKHVDEYRDPDRVKNLLSDIDRTISRPWTIMEVCGGQTHAIMKFGLDVLLPDAVQLLHGPGCPVCVTSEDIIDQAIDLAQMPDVTLCTFGDMIRVPGRKLSLAIAKARGADVRVVYSPMDALALAQSLPRRTVVFFAIGFETTVPTTAMAVHQAKSKGLSNFTLLVSHVRVPPALEALLDTPDPAMNGFLAAGHVCTVMGLGEYEPIARRYKIPIVATGFEPVDILEGLLMCVRQLEDGRAEVENQYIRVVNREGSIGALSMINEVFEQTDQSWRGMGEIALSGLRLRPEYDLYDAAKRYNLADKKYARNSEQSLCISGEVLCGCKRPLDCSAFGTTCTPNHPLGAPMVSSEGACAAYFRYGRARA
jgi:hydrogenase expression/formation protein HypD